MDTDTEAMLDSDRTEDSTGLKPISAIELLQTDHREIEGLFQAYERISAEHASDEEKQILAEQICTLLTVHTMIEEEMFYPAARQALKEQGLLDEAEVEHACAKELTSQIESMHPSNRLFDAKLQILGAYVAHHVSEEEQALFPLIEQCGLDLEQLGQRMNLRKEDLLEA